jgi:hypothetical protein
MPQKNENTVPDSVEVPVAGSQPAAPGGADEALKPLADKPQATAPVDPPGVLAETTAPAAPVELSGSTLESVRSALPIGSTGAFPETTLPAALVEQPGVSPETGPPAVPVEATLAPAQGTPTATPVEPTEAPPETEPPAPAAMEAPTETAASVASVEATEAPTETPLDKEMPAGGAPRDGETPRATGDSEIPGPSSDSEAPQTPQANETTAATTVCLALSEPARLIADENPAAYEDMLTRMSDAVKPADFVEQILVRDAVDLTWEIFRLRRLKTVLLASSATHGLSAVLGSSFGMDSAEPLAREWARREKKAIKQVNEILAIGRLSMDAVIAHALALKVDEFERIDRMIMGAELRRNNALREIDRHRATLGERLRKAVQQVEDAEFQVVELGSAA